ncbi:MAG: D-glycerate dehydrogenase [candidate division WOR-3 bacterium]|nr:MAG: D-glycerate dehydrogenase [candidate division WOR-3 bacterium]
MTTKPRVLLTRLLPQSGIDMLKQNVELEINPEDRVMPKEHIVDRVRDKDGLVCLLTDEIDAEIMDAGKALKVIANYAVGYDNIDVQEATKRKIAVTNTPGVLTETTADLTFALILSVARRIVEGDTLLREGKFTGWAPMLLLGSDVCNKTLGLIGFGRIGRAVARRARGFNMRIIYYEPERLSGDIEEECGVEYKTINGLIRDADYISVHTSLNASTHHLISETEFSLMKKTAYLINASRGPVVDEKALVMALKNKQIAGCALDVYEREPAVEKELLTMPNAVLVPHIGSASVETRTKMAMMVTENIIAVLVHNTTPPNIVNPEVYEK